MKIIKFPLLVFLMLTGFWGITQQQPTLVSTNKAIFKANDTLVLRGRNLFQIELKTIANQNPRYIPKLNLVTEVSGSSDSLYSFIIPANMQNTVYKIKGINTIANDTSINTFVIRVSNNSDSLGIIGWGLNDAGQLNFPVGLSKIVQISAGRYITLALTFDGTVVVWGTNLHGLNNIPSGLKNVVQVAAGDNLCLALKSDGTVVAWGENNYNQLNVPTGLNNIVQVAAGSYFSLALKSDGSITAWGNDIDGQTTIPPGLTNVVQVAAEAYTSLVLKSDSTVFGWGYNGESQTDTVGLSKVVQLATGFSHSLALKSDGNIVPKGNNDENQIVIPSGLRNVKQIAAGSFHSLAITSSDTIVAWGDNFYQQTNIPIGLNNVVDISSGPIADHSFAMYKLAVKTTVFNGTITNTTFFKTGDSVKITYQPNRGYELDSILVNGVKLNDSTNSYTFRNIDSTQNIVVVYKLSVQLISSNKAIFKANDTMVLRGRNLYKIELKTIANQNPQYIPKLDLVTNIIGSRDSLYSFIIPTNLQNTVYKLRGINTILNDTSFNTFVIRVSNNFDSLGIIGWGENTNNQAIIPKSITNIVQIGVGPIHNLALKFDGTVVGSGGSNTYGERTIPTGLDKVVQVVAGGYYSLALKSDGSVIVWGQNSTGLNSVPTGLNNVVQLAVGLDQNLALKSDGSVISWGSNSFGKATVPLGLNNAIQVAAGWDFSLALKSDGSVVAWGNNNRGQIDIPGNAINIVQIAAGNYYTLALKSDGSVIVWGYGMTNLNRVPDGLSNVKQITAGFSLNLALKNNDSLVLWGGNTFKESIIPTGLNNVVDISCGPLSSHSFAMYKLAVKTKVVNGIISNQTFFKKGDSVKITYLPNRGYQLDSIVVNGRKLNDSTNSYTFRNIDTTQNIAAAFKAIPVRLISINKSIVKANDTLVLRAINLSKIELKTLNNQNIQYINRLDSVDDISGSNESIYRFIIPTNLQNTVYKIKGINTIANDTSINTFVIRVSNNSDSLGFIGWGRNDAGQIAVQKGLSNIVQLVPCYDCTFALRSDGTVTGWGRNLSGQLNFPVELTNVVQVAAGDTFGLALKSDGTVVGWGNNSLGQINIPNGLTNVVQVATGQNHGLALRADGTAIGWGDPYTGISNVPGDVNNAIQLAAGDYFNLALRADGTIRPWGNNSNQQTNVPSNSNIKQVAAASENGLSLKLDGSVEAWGYFATGINTKPSGLNNIKQIAAGKNHALALTSLDTVIAWGNNSSNQTNLPSGLRNVVNVSSGSNSDHSYAIYKLAVQTKVFNGTITNTTFFKTGDSVIISYQPNRGNLLDSIIVNGVKVNDSTNSYTFRNLDSTQNIVVYYRVLPIILDSIYKSIFKANDTLVLRGRNLFQIELKTINNQNKQIINFDGRVSGISGSNDSLYRFIIPANLQNTVYKLKGINNFANDTTINSFVIRISNNADSLAIIGWGKNDANQINVPKGIGSIVQVAEGLNYTLALKSDGTVVGWGDNSSGKSTAPADLTNVVQVAAGASHSAALKSDGTVRVWGYNGLGQTNIPSGLTNIVQISTGANHTLALKSDGTAVAWGYDGAGQSIIPNGLNNVVQLAAGYEFSLALKSDGTVVGWGNNSNGQTTIPGNATNVAQIAAGGYHSIAFKADSTAVAWGLNTSGQALNTGNTKFKQISAGSNFSLALILNNTVAVAGDNTYGQRTTPASLNNVVDVSSGPTADHIFAIYKLAVKTQVFNGTITNTTFFKRGDSVRITYQHYRGNLLDSVVVNGVKVNDSTNSYTFRNIDSTQNIVVYYRVLPIKLDSIYKAIYKANDTVVLRGRNLFQIELKTIANQDKRIINCDNWVSGISGSSDSLYRFIIPANLQNTVYKLRGINNFANNTTSNTYVIRISNNSDSLGFIGWGDNFYNQLNAPSDLKNVVQFSTSYHVLALLYDGTVRGWGSDLDNADKPPIGLNNVVQVAAGYFMSLALKPDGTVVAWSNNDFGQLNIPRMLTNVVQLSLGQNYNVALKADGTVFVWGSSSTQPPAGLNNVAQVSVGFYHVLALKYNDTVVQWGSTSTDQRLNFPSGLKNITQIVAGDYHNLAINSDTVVTWGYNSSNQTTKPPGLGFVKQVAAGSLFSLAITRNDTIIAWGRNTVGETNVPAGLTNVVDITSGSLASYSFALYKLSVKTKVVNGTISNQTFVKRGDSVRITYQANNGYFLNYIVVNGTRIYDSLNAYTFRNIDSTQNIEAVFSPIRLDSIYKPIFKANDTLVLSGRNIFKIELKTIANQNRQYISRLNYVTNISGSYDSLYRFIIPTNLQNLVYKLRAINTITNDTSSNTYVIRVSNNFDSLGIIGWGRNDYGQTNIPADLTNIVQLSAGALHSIALKFDGTVVVWGTNLHGLNNIPSGLKNVVQVAAGDNLCLALKSDGTVVAWGENNYNQLNVPTGLNNIVQVAAGSYFSLALKSDGSITAWGNDIDGQTTIPPGLTNVVQVAAEAYTSLVLKSDSTVIGWGYNGESQTDTVGLSKVVQLATGFSHSLALKSDGNIVPKGNNDANQIVIPSGLRNVKQIAAGSFHSLAITNSDTIVAWGDNSYQQTNIPVGLNNVVDISSGPIADHNFAMYKLEVRTRVVNGTISNSLFVKRGDSVRVTFTANQGYNLAYILVNGNFYNYDSLMGYTFRNITETQNIQVVYTQKSTLFSINKSVFKPNDTLIVRGAGINRIEISSINNKQKLYINRLSTVKLLMNSTDSLFSFIITNQLSNGIYKIKGINTNTNDTADKMYIIRLNSNFDNLSIIGWGSNSDLQRMIPAGVDSIVQIAAGFVHSVALKSDGTVRAWGWNEYGQTTVPINLVNVVQVSAGSAHSVALKSDGTVVAWGINNELQSTIPNGLTNVVQVSAGANHTLALKADGTAVDWGQNIGVITIPATVINSNIVQISAGSSHSVALKSDSNVVAWGNNSAGQVSVPTLKKVVQIATGWELSVALQSDSTIVSWGKNDEGLSPIPTPGGNPLKAVQIATGDANIIALKPDSTVIAWGRNDNMQTDVPANLKNVVDLSNSSISNHFFALYRLAVKTKVVNGTISNSLFVKRGDSVRITYQANNGYFLNYIVVNGTRIYDSLNAYTFRNIDSTQNIEAVFSPIRLDSIYKPIFKANDTLVLSGRNIFKIELKTIANQNRQYISRLNYVTNISGSYDSLYRFIIPDSLQNVVYKLRTINTITNDTSTNSFLIRVNNLNFDSLGIIGWGDKDNNQLIIPTGLINIVQFAMGSDHTLALKSDGTVEGWGDNSYGQITIPAGLKNVVDIAAGSYHSLALKSDGTIVVWGYRSSSFNAIPFGLSNVVQIAAGYNHNLALKSDGLLIPWGFNDYTIPADLSDVVQISAGFRHNLAIKSDSTVVGWGNNNNGQTNVPNNLRSVVQIAAGGYHSLALKSDSTIVPWGDSYYYTESKNPIPIGSIKATQIAAGIEHSLALIRDSTLLAWGYNGLGGTNIPLGLNNVVNIYSGSSAGHSIAMYRLQVKTKVTNGTISSSIFVKRGDSVRITYQANDGYVLDYIVVNGNKIYDSANSYTFNNINSYQNIEVFFIPQNNPKLASTNKSIFKLNDTLVIRGRNLYQIELKTIANQNIQYVSKLDSVTSVSGTNDSLYSFIIPDSLQNVVYKIRGINIMTNDTSSKSFVIRVSNNYDSLGVIGWGRNDYSQLNLLAGLSNVVQVATGADHTLALKSDGSVVGWGSNSQGQITIPSDLKNVVQIAAGDQFSVALKSDGTAQAWGSNEDNRATVPPNISNIVQLAAGSYLTLAIKSDGSVLGWDANYQNQITIAAGLRNITQVSTSYNHSLALKTDSTVDAWGYNVYGQGTEPVGLNKVIQIAAGSYFNLALKSDGTVVGWGNNVFGNVTAPPTLTNAKKIAAGIFHSLALTNTDTVVAWGNNVNGQTNIPVGLNNVVDITTGSFSDFSYAMYRLQVKTKALNGTISNNTFVKRGDSVRIIYQPNNGYFLDYIVVNGNTIYDSLNAFTFRNIDSTQNIEAIFSPIKLDSIYKSIFRVKDTLVLRGRNLFQIELKTIANKNTQNIARLNTVTAVNGSRDSLYSFIIPDSLQNVVYKLRAINNTTNDTSTNSFLIRVNNLNFDSLGIIGWGDKDNNQLIIPTGLINIVQFAMGSDHTLALKSDGTVEGWGDNSYGQITIPAGLKNVVDIAAGSYHSLALKSDGTIVVWGYRSSSFNAIPFGLSNVVQIAAGYNHNLALKSDGLLIPWGFNDYTIPADLSDVVQISAGFRHNLAIKSDSTVVGWGNNNNGQTNVPNNLRSVVQIAAGGYHSLALKSDSTIVPWGDSYYYTESKNPIPIGSIKATQIAAGIEHSLALIRDSTLLAWGYNGLGGTNIPLGLNNVVNIYSGSSAGHSIAMYRLQVKTKVTNGTISSSIFVKRGDSVRITYQANDGYVLDYIVVNGNKIYDSANSYTFNNINSYQNIEVFFIPQNNPKLASTNKSIFKAPDTLVIRGRNLYQIELKTIANQNIQYVSKLDSVTSVSGTNDSLYSFIIPDSLQNVVYKIRGINIMTNDTSSKSFVIRVSNNYDSLGVIGWGRNDYSQLNLLAGLSNVVQVATGADHTLALKSDGSVVGWGSNSQGQITIPSDLKNVVQIAAGDQFSVALKSDGTAQAWGSNEDNRATVPPNISNIVQLAAGSYLTLAIKSDGSVLGWDANYQNQITIAAGLRNITQVSTSYNHSLALKTDSTVDAWGYNVYGQGTEPVGLNKVIQIAAGSYFNLALKSDGTVVGWGNNIFGNVTAPPTLTNAKKIAAGIFHSLALTNTDTVVAWGNNVNGQTNIPVGLNNVVDITTGSFSDFSFALYRLAVKTKVVNGTISNSLFVKRGDSVRITYQANNGYFLDYIVVNGFRIYDSLNAYTFRNIDSTQNIEAVFSPIRLDSIYKPIFKTNDTLVLRGRNIFQIELKTIANQNRQYISRLDAVTNISGSRDSLYRFIIPDSLQNVVYKLRAINTITNDTSTNSFLIRLNNINFDSLGIIGWGDNQYNQLNRPTGLINIVQFALGNAHTLALKSDGTVVGWGYSSNGQITIPAGLKNVVDIAAGYLHSLALKSDGTIVVWGNNSSSYNAIPNGLNNVVQVAAGNNHNLALKSDGLLVPWGFNNYTIPAGLSDVVQISAGYDHNLAIKSDSTVAAWGDNGSGQTNVPSNLRSVIQIAAGGYHSLSLKSDSTIVPWGYSYYYTESKNPVPIGSIKATQIAAGLEHSLALKTDSTVLAWGYNGSGQINIPVGLNNVVNIYSGSSANHNFAIFKLEVKTKVENGTITNNIFFKRGDSVKITYQPNNGYVLDYIVVNGNKMYDSANSYTFNNINSYQNIEVFFIPQNNPKLASTNKSIFKLNDTLVIRGRNLYQIELKTIANQNIQYVSKLDSVTSVSGTNDSLYSFIIPDSLQNVVYKIRGINIMTNDTSSKSFVIRVSNNYDSLGVIGWGRNDYSQLNLLAGLSNVVQVATGADHTLALKSDGSVVGWGSNSQGQITIPSDLKNVVQIAAGDQFSVALKSDGTAQAWGSNDEDRATIPIGLSNIVQLAAGNQFGLALKSDGSAIGWGDNSLGQITIPSGLNNIIQIGTGFNHSLALKSDSTVAAWGYNNYGERDIPANLRSVVQIAVGADFNLALKSDGTVVGWGYNGQGQTSIPPTLTNAKQIAAGGYHCVALTNADTIVAWGRNTDGQTNIPAGLNNVVEIISGSNSDFSFAMYKKLNIISSAGIGGTISPAGQTLVNYGARPTYIISANTGYELDSLVINGVKVRNINSYTFESVKSNQTIRVTFKVRTFTVTSSAGNNGSISFAGIDTVNYGDTLTYKFVANTGYVVDSLLINDSLYYNGLNLKKIDSFTFDSIKSNQTIRVTFKVQTFTVLASAGNGGNISPVGDSVVNYGDRPTYIITANTGYEFDSLLINGNKIADTNSYTFDSVISNQSIRAIFRVRRFTVTASSGIGGNISPVGDSVVNYGDRPTYTITTNTGYVIDSVLINDILYYNGLNLAKIYSFKFDSIKSNQTIRVTFKVRTFTVNSSAGNNGSISFAGIDTVNYGDTLTYKFVANTGYVIDSLLINDSLYYNGLNLKKIDSFTLDSIKSNQTIRVTFKVQTFTVTASAGIGGNISPVGDSVVNYGDRPTYIISANTGYELDSLLINGNKIANTNSYTFDSVISNQSIRAIFRVRRFTVTASAGIGGNISPVGDSVVNYGDRPTYTITANTGYVIDSVLINDILYYNGLNLAKIYSFKFDSIKSNQSIRVTFKVQTFTVTSSAGNNGSISFAGIDTVNYGDTLTYKFVANTGYVVDSLLINDSLYYSGLNLKKIDSFTFDSIKSNQTIRVTFKVQTFTVLASAGNGGNISPVGDSVVNYGARPTYTITANTGYEFDSLLINGNKIADTNSYTFDSVISNQSIRAIFRVRRFTVTASSGIGGNISPVGDSVVNYGYRPTYTITANTGYELDSLVINGNKIANTNSYTFDSVISNQSIRAIFRVRRFTITASAGIGGSISPSGNIIVDYGTNQPFIITANYGYIIDTILINGNKVNSVTNYTFNSVTSNQTIYAAFKAITKPSKPINVQASPGNAQATISFNSPLDNGSVPIVKYIVQVVGGTIKDSINTNLSSNNSITIKGLLNGVSYIFSVIAVNSFGLASDTALSNTVVTNANLRNISTETKNGTITSATAIIAGNNIQITYAPNQGYTLDSIFINNNYSSRITLDSMNSYTFYNVMGDSSIKVVYKIKTYTISASAGNNGSISPVGISTVEYGTRPMYTITANTGFVIDSLLINGVKVTNVYSYIFDSIKTDQIIRVTFKIQTFTINAFAGSGGSINSAGITTVNYGARPTYTITAKMGYEVDSLLINGVKITNVDSYTFDSIKSDQTITVTFKLITFTITASAGNGGNISPSGITMVDYGTRPTYTIKANSGFEIDSLLLNDVKITNVTNYIFDSIKSNQTIRVTFKLQTFTIVANAGSAGSINPSGIITVNYGTRPSFTITAITGYEIDSLLLNDVQITNVTNYVFDSIKSNQSIRVTFKVQTFTIMASAGNGGVIKPAGITTVNYGDRPTYSIIANYGYVLDSLLVNGINKMINDTNYTFDSVISNQTIYATFKEITNPSKPLNIEAFPGNAQATISFSSPLDNGGVPVVKYIVQVDGGTIKDSIYTSASSDQLVIMGLLNDVSYRFSVRAVNSFGLVSDTALSNFVLLDSNLRNINTEITNGTITKDTSVIFGNNVRITYKPNEGYILDSIFINNSYSSRITLDSINSYTFYNILADSSIKVKNKIQTFTITASAGSNGVISPSGITTVNYGARPTYTIAANTGYVIDNLLINGVKINNISRYTFNSINSDQTISVTFKVQTFTITASAGIGGTISPSGVDIVNYGTRPTYTITANTGYEIASLFINGIKVNNVGNYTFDSIKSNQTIGVTFKIQTFTISATVKNGTISPSGINVYNFGSSQMFTFSPTNPNYVLDSLVIDGVLQANYVNNSYTFNGIQQNHSIYVVYIQKYTINISSNIGGVVTPATNQQVQIGASLRVSWVVNQGYLLDSVLINGVRNTDSLNSYTFTNIQANQSIRVVFKQKTVLPNNNFNIAVTQPNCVLSSGTLQISANVSEYYKISIQAANRTNIIDSFRGLTYSRMLTDTGLYKLSITLVDTMFTNLNRYFEFIVKYPKAITAYSEIESQERLLTLSLSGAAKYEVVLNGQLFTTELTTLKLPLQTGVNRVVIKSDLQCQDSIVKTIIVSESVTIYPNPVKDYVNINVGGEERELRVELYDNYGKLVISKNAIIDENRNITIDMHLLKSGVYYVKLKGTTVFGTYSLLKGE